MSFWKEIYSKEKTFHFECFFSQSNFFYYLSIRFERKEKKFGPFFKKKWIKWRHFSHNLTSGQIKRPRSHIWHAWHVHIGLPTNQPSIIIWNSIHQAKNDFQKLICAQNDILDIFRTKKTFYLKKIGEIDPNL